MKSYNRIMFDIPKPHLGEVAQQIVADVPTEMHFGNWTIQLNNTFEGQLQGVSYRLQRQQAHHRIPVTEAIFLPGMTSWGDLFVGQGLNCDPRVNNEMQAFLAMKMGILEPEELFHPTRLELLKPGRIWSNFLRRPNIVAVNEWKTFNSFEDNPDVIPGMKYTLPTKNGQQVQYMGQPHYLRAGTKYPGVDAIIRFKTVGHSNVPLDELVATNRTTLLMQLLVPSSELLPPISPKSEVAA